MNLRNLRLAPEVSRINYMAYQFQSFQISGPVTDPYNNKYFFLYCSQSFIAAWTLLTG